MAESFTLPLRDPLAIAALIGSVFLVVPMLAERLRLPGLVGLLLAGAAIGPNALGLLERNVTMELFGTVGLLYLMFVIGLELDIESFRRYRTRSLVYGTICVLLANGIGVVIGMLVLGMGLAPSLLVASIFTSHTLLAFPVVSRLGLARDPAATTAVGAVIVTDTVSLLILAAVVGSATGEAGTGFYLRLVVGFAAFAAAVFLLLPRLARWFFRRFANDRGGEYLFAVTIVLLAAVVGRLFGVQPILAAFFAGLALNRLIPETGTLMNRIGFIGSTLFIPAFLVSVGMLVDLRVFGEGDGVWRAALALVGGVTLTKVIGAKLVQRVYRYSPAQGWMIYGLSAPQAAGTLAVVLVGFDVGLFAADLLNGAVAMILVTCVAGPVVAQRSGRTVAREARRAPQPSEAVPRRVLVPLVHPAAVDALVDIAVLIRERDTAEPLFPLTVVLDSADARASVAEAEALLSHAVLHAAAAEAVTTPLTRIAPNPVLGIARAAAERRITDIVMGWKGSTSTRERIFGSVIDRVLAETRQQVLVCKLGSRLDVSGRTVLVLPPLVAYHPAYPQALRSVHNLVGRLRTEWITVTVGDAAEAAPSPEGSRETVRAEGWEEALAILRRTLREGDLLVALSARRGTLPYGAALESLPETLGAMVENLIVVYPSELDAEEAANPLSQVLLRLREEHVVHAAPAPEWRAAVAPLLATVQGLGIDADEVAEALAGGRTRLAVEAAQGVMILHGHSRGVDQPTLRLLVAPQGVDAPSTNAPVRLLLVLLSPLPDRSQRHVSTLADLGRVIADASTVSRLAEAETAADVVERLRRSHGDGAVCDSPRLPGRPAVSTRW